MGSFMAEGGDRCNGKGYRSFLAPDTLGQRARLAVATMPVVYSSGAMLRLLTQVEYLTSVQSLLGTLTTRMTPLPDVSIARSASVGAIAANVTDMARTAYEAASFRSIAWFNRSGARNYVWSSFLGDFVASDGFRSAHRTVRHDREPIKWKS